MTNLRNIGKKYEQQACAFLEDKGYRIVANNYSCKFGEIDIIAVKDRYICFVEVKYRSSNTHGNPEEAVTYHKMKKICKSAEFFLFSHKMYMDFQMRFDVISILGDKIQMYENAFDFLC